MEQRAKTKLLRIIGKKTRNRILHQNKNYLLNKVDTQLQITIIQNYKKLL